MAHNIAAKIQELENMGFVDGQLALCYSLQEAIGNFFGDLLRLFCREASTHLQIMQEILDDDDVVDYQYLLHVCQKFQGASRSVGAVQVASVCSDLCEVCSTDCSEYWCIILLSEIITEFNDLKEHLDEILEVKQFRSLYSRTNFYVTTSFELSCIISSCVIHDRMYLKHCRCFNFLYSVC